MRSDQSLVEESGGTEKRKRVDLEKSTDLMAGGLRVSTQVNSRTRTEEGKCSSCQLASVSFSSNCSLLASLQLQNG